MTTANFESAAALVADVSRTVANEVESALKQLGFQDVRLAGTLAQAAKRLGETRFDLLVIGCEWPDGNVSDLITAVRHGQAGDNPFLAVVVTGSDDELSNVGYIMRHGAEAFITPPFAAAPLSRCLETQIASRQPFVVTSDYVGPDRRGADNRKKSLIPLLEVPNSLRDKANGTYSADAAARAITAMMAEINIEKLQRHVEKVGMLISRVGPDMMVDGVDEKVRTFLEELMFVADDIARRVKGTHFEGIVAACGQLVAIAKLVHKRSGVPKTQEVDRLLGAAQAVMKGFAAAAVGG